MCNRARNKSQPEDETWFGDGFLTERPRDNRFNPVELAPRSRAYVVREDRGRRGMDVMSWDVLGGQASWPVTNVGNLGLRQWRALAAKPKNRCVVPVTEFAEWTTKRHHLCDGKTRPAGEMWFSVIDRSAFAIAGLWQSTKDGPGFTMVTCEANDLVRPTQPEAMVTILDPADVSIWLRGSYDEIVALQRPYDPSWMTVRGPVFPTAEER